MPDPKASGTVWEVPAGKFSAASTKLWNLLGQQGARVIDQLDDDKHPDFRKRVSDCMLNGAWPPILSSQIAAAAVIMGQENIWFPTDWCRYFGYQLSEDDIKQAAEIPFSPEVLARAKADFFLYYAMPVFSDGRPLTVNSRWWQLVDKVGIGPWIGGLDLDSLRRDTLSGWQLVRKEVFPDSTGKSNSEQLVLLPPHLTAPSAIQELAKSALYYAKTGRQVNPKVCSRTRSFIHTTNLPDPDRCLTVGYYQDRAGWGITVYWAYLEQEKYPLVRGSTDYSRQKHIGMGAAWKPQV